MQARDMRSSQPALVIGLVQPAVLVAITASTAHDQSPRSGTTLVCGVMLTSLWSATIWSAGGILRREQWQGTLAANVTSVLPPYLVLLGKCLGATLIGTSIISATAALVTAGLGIPVQLAEPGWLVVGMLAVVLSGAGLGMLLSSVMLLTRYGPQVASALMYPVFILGGLLIPARMIPGPLRWISAVFSFQQAERFIIAASAGHVLWKPLTLAFLLTAIYFVIGCWAFARVVNYARKGGTLELV